MSLYFKEMESRRVYLGLGGNEGNVLLCLQRALDLLSNRQEIFGLTTSHFYQTAPWQATGPTWFVNAVCYFQTVLTPEEIFKITQEIESQLGKIAKPRHAPRPIDIDLLFYGHHLYQKGGLTIPHPRWKERLFVLIPLENLTSEILLYGQAGHERYLLKDLIKPLLIQSPHAVSLLEKNPRLS